MQAETEKMWTGISQEYLKYYKAKSWNQAQNGSTQSTVFEVKISYLCIKITAYLMIEIIINRTKKQNNILIFKIEHYSIVILQHPIIHQYPKTSVKDRKTQHFRKYIIY